MSGSSAEPTLLTVAHRAGNNLGRLRAALDADVDLVEADVHRFRRTLELRHEKSLGPALLWERDRVTLRRALDVPDLAAALRTARGDPRLLLDLKGIHPALAPAVAALLRRVAPDAAIAVCTQHWWMLRHFDGNVRLIPSAGNRLQLRRLRRLLQRPARFGLSRRPFAVSVQRALLTPELVRELHGGAEFVLTWPVDSADELTDARRLGVSGVISKDLELLRGLRSGS